MEAIPNEMGPYYDYVFILCIPICEKCDVCPEFPSKYPQFSDEWYMDQAIGIKSAGWVIPELEKAFCKKCAEEEDVRHDPNAFGKGNGRMWSLIGVLVLIAAIVISIMIIV